LWLQSTPEQAWASFLSTNAVAAPGQLEKRTLAGRWLFFGFSKLLAKTLRLGDCCESAVVWSANDHSSQLSSVLGDLFDGLVFNAWAGFHPDRLALLTGTLCGGGLLVLISPTAADWPSYADPEYERLISTGLEKGDGHALPSGHYLRRASHLLSDAVRQGLVETDPANININIKKTDRHTPSADDPLPSRVVEHRPLLPTADQDTVVKELLAAIGPALVAPACHAAGPVSLLTGARGRGKSQVLAYVLAHFALRGYCIRGENRPVRAVVIVPHAAAAVTLKRYFASRSLTIAENGMVGAHLRLAFFTPAAWLAKEGADAADLLLIEEAATLPFTVLGALLAFSGPIMLATTIIGYEGSGRVLAAGFEHWLGALFQTSKAGVTAHRRFQRWTLSKPLRWSDSDTLEPFLNKLLLLDTQVDIIATRVGLGKASSVPASKLDLDACDRAFHIDWIEQSVLADSPQLLLQVWALLYGAHYRTRPSDLRALLDQPGVQVVVARSAGRVIGAAWFVLEGPFPADLAEEMRRNRRRPRGHLLPQIMALRLGYGRALVQTHLRCVRIAVDLAHRRQGIAQSLLAAAEDKFAVRVASIGASCALQQDTAQFWQSCGFRVLRLGVKPNARSGAINFAVFRPLNDEMRDWSRVHSALFWTSWTEFSKVFAPPASISHIEHFKQSERPGSGDDPDKIGWKSETNDEVLLPLVKHQRLCAFANGTSEEADVAGLLGPLWLKSPPSVNSAALNEFQRDALKRRVCCGEPWHELLGGSGFASKKQALSALRQWVGRQLPMRSDLI
jgi:tRNA(Met) cytidine acetyltransferase